MESVVLMAKPKRSTSTETARRLNLAADGNINVPKTNLGRYTHIAKQVSELTRAETVLTPESVRRWFAGISRPSEENMAALAQILGVDFDWLLRGTGGENPHYLGVVERPAAAGVTDRRGIGRHLLIGIVGTSEAKINSIPTTGPVHVVATVQGATYALVGVIGQHVDGDQWSFAVPSEAQGAVVLGITPIGPARYQVYVLDNVIWGEVGGEAILNLADEKEVDFFRRF